MLPSLSSHRTEVYDPKTFFLHAALLGQAFAHCPIFPTAASRRSLGRVSVPMWPINLSVRLLIVDLVGRYLTNYLIRRGPLFPRIAPLITAGCPSVILCGISTSFPVLSPGKRQVAHALLTRPPLSISFRPWPKPWASGTASFDLHVLSTPPAFILSQDQTLRYISLGLTLETSLTFLNLLILSLRSTHLRVSPGALLSGLFFKLKFFGKRLLKDVLRRVPCLFAVQFSMSVTPPFLRRPTIIPPLNYRVKHFFEFLQKIFQEF